MKATKLKITFLLGLVFLANILPAQYFGQNKAKYKTLDFEVYESPHFEIYHYLNNEACLHDLTQHAEQWYALHQAILQDTFTEKNPIIFYNNHADFQQTNTVSGNIGVGTGGVTEGFKNRVIMPLTLSNQQTHHVLGHELVHAFQYHMVLKGDSTSIRNFANLPLFMVEGLAEYLSIGRVDAHTAMWMRDAVLNKDIPEIKDLYNPKYFPYRWGQAFWAFLTGVYGDEVIEPFFIATAKYGFEPAIKRVLGTNMKDLSKAWVSTLEKHYTSQMGKMVEKPLGRKLLSEKNAGRMNLSPVVSPNGRYTIFLSEKSLFSLDLYLADARTGKIIRKVASTNKDGHIDDFNYIESAGTWSPNSRQFAYVVFSKGINKLVVKDVSNGKTVKEIAIPGVPAFSNPTWSADGKTILVSGLVDGQTDLYAYHLKTKKVEQLTNDKYAELQPQWSADGRTIVFASDRQSITRGRTNGKWTYNIATLDIETKAQKDFYFFFGADNFNPVFDHEQNIIFISDRNGYRNMYKYDFAADKVYQLTDFLTGVSGITKYSPAISASHKRDRILYTHFSNNKYTIYQVKQEDLLHQEIAPDSVSHIAATLPLVNPDKKDIVTGNLSRLDNIKDLPDSSFTEKDYKPKFKLDYIGGSAGVGVGTGNSVWGSNTALTGGVDMLFSDILGNNQLYTGIALNGELTDFSGQVAYINRKHKIAWGASLSHLVGRSGFSSRPVSDVLVGPNGEQIPVQRVDLTLSRVFQENLGLFAHFPLSRTNRFEAGVDFTHYGFRDELQSLYYDNSGFLLLAGDKEKVDNALPGFNLMSTNAAFVSDNAQFGIASPLNGHRYRIGAEQYFGAAKFTTTLVDFRQYKYLRPISLAFRGMHYARYGQDANALPPLYAGNPVFVRGYGYNSISEILQNNDLSFNQLTGSKLFVGNFEVRLPFTGPERLSAIKSKFFFSDLALFVDGGVAFNEWSDFGGSKDTGATLSPKAIFSTGLSMRINLFGALILEPYYAIPLQGQTRGVFGLNIVPGW